MAPKKASGSSKASEEKRVRKTFEFKKELITKHESGVRVSVCVSVRVSVCICMV